MSAKYNMPLQKKLQIDVKLWKPKIKLANRALPKYSLTQVWQVSATFNQLLSLYTTRLFSNFRNISTKFEFCSRCKKDMSLHLCEKNAFTEEKNTSANQFYCKNQSKACKHHTKISI